MLVKVIFAVKDIPDNCIVVENPAKLINYLNQK